MQLEFFDVPSPCINICQSDTKGFCLGCLRTREERQNWINLSNDGKQKVIKRCQQRKRRKETAVKAKKQIIDVKESTGIEQKELQPSLLDPLTKENTHNPVDLDFGDFEL